MYSLDAYKCDDSHKRAEYPDLVLLPECGRFFPVYSLHCFYFPSALILFWRLAKSSLRRFIFRSAYLSYHGFLAFASQRFETDGMFSAEDPFPGKTDERKPRSGGTGRVAPDGGCLGLGMGIVLEKLLRLWCGFLRGDGPASFRRRRCLTSEARSLAPAGMSEAGPDPL